MISLLLNRITSDCLITTLKCSHSHKSFKPGLATTIRKYDDSSIGEFKMNLSYENWENVFNFASDNDVNVIFNNFLGYVFKDILL